MINIEELDKIAKIARLSLEDSEKKALLKDIENILAAFSEIENLEESEKELFYATESKNPLREDSSPVEYPSEKILEVAPKKEDNYFKVPKLLE